MWIFIFFNFTVVFICSWLYLGGARKVKSIFSRKDRNNKREMSRRQNGDKA